MNPLKGAQTSLRTQRKPWQDRPRHVASIMGSRAPRERPKAVELALHCFSRAQTSLRILQFACMEVADSVAHPRNPTRHPSRIVDVQAFPQVQKGRPKSHIGMMSLCRFPFAMCNLERPFCTFCVGCSGWGFCVVLGQPSVTFPEPSRLMGSPPKVGSAPRATISTSLVRAGASRTSQMICCW